MSAFNFESILATLKDVDYIALSKLVVPWHLLLQSPTVNLVLIAHIALFGLIFGAMLWVTFISGVVLFKSLPKPQFGVVQSYLFPWYFRVTSFSLFWLLACVLAEQHDMVHLGSELIRLLLEPNRGLLRVQSFTENWNIEFDIFKQQLKPFLHLTIHNVQLGLLFLAYFASLTQQFVLGPLTTRAMFKRHRINEELAKKPQDAKLQKQAKKASGAFGAIHGISSLYNLGILLVVLAHGVYLATVVLQFAQVPAISKLGAATTSTKSK